MSEKKLSFGFTKTIRKVQIIPKRQTEAPKAIQLIDCLEGQSIKIKDAVIEEEKKPLVIPIQTNDKNLVERVIAAKKLKERSKESTKNIELEDNRPDSELSLDELAARQLIREAKSSLEGSSSKNGTTKVHVVPAVEDTLILEGSKEPTLHDYENVPIADFGLAMLRGMGWNEQTGIGKDKKSVSMAVPELRPKGMGLGAYKMVQEEAPKKAALDKNGKELSLVKGACAKVIAGKEKGFYCKIEGLDDEGGRIIVKMAIKGTTLSLNEFMLSPVTQEEYSASSRILNNSKYRDYQEKEAATSSGQVDSKNTSRDTKITKTEIKRENLRSKSPDNVTKREKHNRRLSRSPIADKKGNGDKIDYKKERRSYKSRSPTSYKKETSSKSSKHRSRSRSKERHSYKKHEESKRHRSSRRSRSFDESPARRSTNDSRNRSESPRRSKDQSSKSSKSKPKYSRSSSSSSVETILKICEKSKNDSDESGSESSDYYERKRKDKKKSKKDKQKKVSKKCNDSDESANSDADDDDDRKKSKYKKKNDGSSGDDDDRSKKKSSKRRSR